MTPAKDRVIIKRIDEEVKTEAGLFLPESQQGHVAYAKVVSVYQPYGDKACQVPPGCKVLTAKHSGIDMGHDNLYVIHENEIIAFESL